MATAGILTGILALLVGIGFFALIVIGAVAEAQSKGGY